MTNVQLTEGVAVRANTVLAAYLAETGLTQAGLADAVNAVVEDLTGIPGRASDRWVRMLVDGSIRWPRHHYRQALEIVLQAPIDELGFRCPVDAVSADHAAQPAAASQTRLSTADVVRLRAPLDHLVASADGCGAATLAPQAARHATVCQDMLRDAVVSERVERAMYVLIGDYWAAAGWFALDSGDLSSAQRHLDAGLRAAGIAREGSLQTYVWSVTEKCARLRGDYAHALGLDHGGVCKVPLWRTRALLHPWWEAGASPAGLLHAIDHHPDHPQQHRGDALRGAHDPLRVLGYRLRPWRGRLTELPLTVTGIRGDYQTKPTTTAPTPELPARSEADKSTARTEVRLAARAALDAHLRLLREHRQLG